MKKILLFSAALFTAISISAKTINIDLSSPINVSGSNPATFTYADETLLVEFEINSGYAVSGAEIAINNIENVTGISFEIKGDGSGKGFLHYLRDSEGNRWYDSGSWYGLGDDWVSRSSVPAVTLWDGQPAEDFGKYPFTKIGFVANPSTTGTGSFSIRNVVISVKDEDPTALDNTVVEGKAAKMIENGQMLILLEGKTYTITGQQLR